MRKKSLTVERCVQRSLPCSILFHQLVTAAIFLVLFSYCAALRSWWNEVKEWNMEDAVRSVQFSFVLFSVGTLLDVILQPSFYHAQAIINWWSIIIWKRSVLHQLLIVSRVRLKVVRGIHSQDSILSIIPALWRVNKNQMERTWRTRHRTGMEWTLNPRNLSRAHG